MTTPFGPREFQLVLLRRMADHQPGLVEDSRHDPNDRPRASLAEMREANRRWQAMVRAPGGRGAGSAPTRWALAITGPGTGRPYVAEFARGLFQRLLPG
ncbi:hypothetical protein ACH4CE_32755 [Streptomyces gelaticus]|uniref:hypothetical protein n=1 Tax=Streptomyces gelaticus TaxID=285446 RepID=UPI0037876490